LIPTDAVIYLPDDVEDDRGLLARRGIAHAERRGYRLVGVLRDLALVLRLASEGTVVVLAKRAHWPSRQATAGVKRELVGEETCGLIPFIVNGEIVHRAVVNEVMAYRSGYADGYVDSVTLQSAKRRWDN